MRILFTGWNENGERCLEAIVARINCEIVGVLIPQIHSPFMESLCRSRNIPLALISSVDDIIPYFEKESIDLLVVASFPWRLPLQIIRSPRLGTINVHAGGLPKYRGCHPLNWAIIKDEPTIGVSVHIVDEGLDTGPLLEQAFFPIDDCDDILSVREVASTLGATLLSRSLDRISGISSRAEFSKLGRVQCPSEASFAPKRGPHDSKVDFHWRTREIFNHVRALTGPYPNAFAFDKDGNKISFSKCYIPPKKEIGTVIAQVNGSYLVATKDGAILLECSRKLSIGEKLF